MQHKKAVQRCVLAPCARWPTASFVCALGKHTPPPPPRGHPGCFHDYACFATQNFISDIRGSQNKEQEARRIDKELAKIRAKFSDDKSLNGGPSARRGGGCSGTLM